MAGLAGHWYFTSAPDGNAVTDLTIGNLTKLRSEVVADVARLQIIAPKVSLNSGESSYLKVQRNEPFWR